MKMDGGLVEHRREIIGHVNGKVIKKRKVRRRSSSSSITPSKSLQRLYSFCKQVFKGPGIVPASQDVQNLCHILGENVFPLYYCFYPLIICVSSFLILCGYDSFCLIFHILMILANFICCFG